MGAENNRKNKYIKQITNNLKNKIMRTKIEDFLSELSTEVDVLNYVDIDNIDMSNPFDSICEMIEDNNGFDIEIVYYSKAMEYLMENDPSLQDSLNLAYELGFTVDSLNSEILASLLLSETVKNDFYELEEAINDFFEQLI